MSGYTAATSYGVKVFSERNKVTSLLRSIITLSTYKIYTVSYLHRISTYYIITSVAFTRLFSNMQNTIQRQVENLKLRHTFHENVLHFKFSEKYMKNDIEKANLYFWLRGLDKDEENLPVTISLQTVSRSNSQGDNLILIASHTEKKNRPSCDGEWFSIDITNLVSQWFRSPRSNLGIVIKATIIGAKEPHAGKPLVPTEVNDDQYTPYLEVYMKEKEKHRKKRDLGMTCDEKSNEVNCCRYPLTVDFDSFGWTFVIAPKRYEAYYCSGECPFVFLPTYPHTHVRQMAQPKQPQSSQNHGPCCAAKKMSSLSMLYFDDSQSIIFGTLPGMVVDRCGCQ